MAPLARPAFLAVLLLAPGLARAQMQATQDDIANLKKKYSMLGMQAPLVPAATPVSVAAVVDPALLAASKAVVASAGIAPEKVGWTDQNIADLGPAIKAASAAVKKLHADVDSPVGDTFYGNGTMVNLEQSIGAATRLWPYNDYKRGCVSHQNVTIAAVAPILAKTSLVASDIGVMRGVGPHHAVIVFPRGTDWKKTGVIFDGWIHQESAPNRMTYLFKDWYGLTSWKVALE